MAGILTSFVVAGLLTASPDGFSFDGPQVTARTVGNVGFFTQGPIPFSDLFERGTGSVELSAQDRIQDPRAVYGDSGSLELTFTLGGTSYRVELAQAGFPPAEAMKGAPVSGPLPPPPAQRIAGGVVMNEELHGTSGLGFSNTSQEHAAAALWGVGRVWRNGALLTDTALIYAAAITTGTHADDDTFRILPVGRPGDSEVEVLVWNLPPESEPRGFLQFGFDDVSITINGSDVPSVARVPTAGAFVGVAPPTTPVPGGASLGAVPNTTGQQQGVGGSGAVSTTSGTSTTGTGGVVTGVATTQTTTITANPSTDGLSNPALTQQVAPQADVTVPSGARALGNTDETFVSPGRVTTATQATAQADGSSRANPTPIVPEAFTAPDVPGRVALSVSQPTSPGRADTQVTVTQPTPFVPDAFQDAARQTTSLQRAPASLNSFVPLTSTTQQPTGMSTSGSFSVVPLVPGVSTSTFAFGGPRIASTLVQTPSPQQAQTVAVPLVSSPQPLNVQQPVPLVAGPLPLNGQAAVPLISSPAPLNSQPVSAVPPASTAPAATTAPVPGLLPAATPSTVR